MSSSIARSVREIKRDLESIVAARQIVRLCQAAGHAWRDRTLGVHARRRLSYFSNRRFGRPRNPQGDRRSTVTASIGSDAGS